VTARPRLILVGIVTAILFTAAACGSSATSAPPSSSGPGESSGATGSVGSLPSAISSALGSLGAAPDASSLVSADMAASVIGGTATPVTLPITFPNFSAASFNNESGDELTIFVESIPGGLANAQLQAAIAVAGAQGSLQPVGGIGDAAGKVVDTNEATVAFVKGTTLVVLNAKSDTKAGSDLEPKVESLAQQVVGKL